jgi:hypothetical protein
MFCRSPNSLHQLLMPETTPRYSSFEACSSCDKPWTSFESSSIWLRSSCRRFCASDGVKLPPGKRSLAKEARSFPVAKQAHHLTSRLRKKGKYTANQDDDMKGGIRVDWRRRRGIVSICHSNTLARLLDGRRSLIRHPVNVVYTSDSRPDYAHTDRCR